MYEGHSDRRELGQHKSHPSQPNMHTPSCMTYNVEPGPVAFQISHASPQRIDAARLRSFNPNKFVLTGTSAIK